MEDCEGCIGQEVSFNIKKQAERTVPTVDAHGHPCRRRSGGVDSITLNFSCETRIKKTSVVRDVTNLPIIVMEKQLQPLIFNSVVVDRPQILYSDTTHEAVKREIGGWNISNYWREWMIKNVLSSVRDMVKTVPAGFNALDVLVEVVVVTAQISATDVILSEVQLRKAKSRTDKSCRRSLASRLRSVPRLFSKILSFVHS